MMPDFDEEARKACPCTCIDAYKDRNLDDPQCAYHNYGDMVVTALREAYERGRRDAQEEHWADE